MKPVKPSGYNKNSRIAVILAGGLSKRFGKDKAYARLGKKSFIERIVETLQRARFEVFISVANPKKFPGLGKRLLEDPLPGEGPLQALYGALLQLNCPRLLLVACDMPLIVPSVIEELWERGQKADITCLEFQGRIFPLPAVYSKNVIPYAKDSLDQRRRDLKTLLKRDLKIQTLCDLDGKSTFNINTSENLREATYLIL